jgi:hypothetical protein
MSQYVALYFLASRNAEPPSFSMAGDGVFDSLGAPYKLAAIATELARKSLRLSMFPLVY